MAQLRHGVQKLLGQFGLKISRIESSAARHGSFRRASNPTLPANPVWPLPRGNEALTSEQIRQQFAKYDSWHYAYEFEGGLSFPIKTAFPGPLTDLAQRPLLRYRHFMPYLLEAFGGSIRGKRVLDIACNSGFWSVQCALLGADVVAFDARPELIKQAELIKSIVGVANLEFRQLDFWEMRPETLGGTFDIVLNLGILYHLPDPLKALGLTTKVAHDCILLDTEVHPSADATIQLRWEEPHSIRSANRSGIVALPSKQSLELMFRDIGVRTWAEVPLHMSDMPRDYLDGNRASWLIRV
jgi:2-polyprenyl-3-methyl-5-hydroxy-6-metoxy-1,4-benzoquinol methylase